MIAFSCISCTSAVPSCHSPPFSHAVSTLVHSCGLFALQCMSWQYANQRALDTPLQQKWKLSVSIFYITLCILWYFVVSFPSQKAIHVAVRCAQTVMHPSPLLMHLYLDSAWLGVCLCTLNPSRHSSGCFAKYYIIALPQSHCGCTQTHKYTQCLQCSTWCTACCQVIVSVASLLILKVLRASGLCPSMLRPFRLPALLSATNNTT